MTLSPAPLRRALEVLGAVALAYGLAILLLALGGATPSPAPWLTIPTGSYFYWEAAFIPVVIVLSGLLAAVLAHLIALALGGSGAFEDGLSRIAFATAAATCVSLGPDLVIGGCLQRF